MIMRRVPIDPDGATLVFAAARLALGVVALIGVVATGFPYQGRAAAVLTVFVLWAGAVLIAARKDPEVCMHPAVPAVDLSLLRALELVAPDTMGGVRLAALFMIAAHAHFQGERRGLVIAACGSVAL